MLSMPVDLGLGVRVGENADTVGQVFPDQPRLVVQMGDSIQVAERQHAESKAAKTGNHTSQAMQTGQAHDTAGQHEQAKADEK